MGLTDDFLLQRNGAGAARRTFHPVAKLANINLQLADGTAEGIAVHAQLARGAALISFVFLEDGEDETFFELANTFRIKNIAAIHLQDEGF